MEFCPIGHYHSNATYPQQAPRQANQPGQGAGQIILLEGDAYRLALRDLEGFERLWLIYQFHHNTHWKPLARPPIPPPDKDKVGVFASRSPYRPNPIGLSAVLLQGIQGNTLSIQGADLLDGTPILDIKPYIPAFDSFPDSRIGWLAQQNLDQWRIEPSEEFTIHNHWIKEKTGYDLEALAYTQLSHNPFDSSRKRISVKDHQGTLAFRTWRIQFSFCQENRAISLLCADTGYSADELLSPEDPYHDKEIHRAWIANRKKYH